MSLVDYDSDSDDEAGHPEFARTKRVKRSAFDADYSAVNHQEADSKPTKGDSLAERPDFSTSMKKARTAFTDIRRQSNNERIYTPSQDQCNPNKSGVTSESTLNNALKDRSIASGEIKNGISSNDTISRKVSTFKPLSASKRPNHFKQAITSTIVVAQEASLVESIEKKSPIPSQPLFTFLGNLSSTSAQLSGKRHHMTLSGAGDENEDNFDVTLGSQLQGSTPINANLEVDERCESIDSSISEHQSSDKVDISELNLPESELRKVVGRDRSRRTDVRILNFRLDQEYADNSALQSTSTKVIQRASHAPAPGKHSLKQLVNAACVQRDVIADAHVEST